MSRVAKQPVELPKGVEFKMDGRTAKVKGSNGELSLDVHASVDIAEEGNQLNISAASPERDALALAGTTRALLANMVTGVSKGFEKKLQLVGIGYRAKAQGKVIDLTLGFSHPVKYQVPEGITIETPSQTEIVVKGADKQAVGQVAAQIRAYRPPEPYKGKGVRYADERVVIKEAKKT